MHLTGQIFTIDSAVVKIRQGNVNNPDLIGIAMQ